MGKWEGFGEEKLTTINSFKYIEELNFTSDGFNDLIHYEQRTWLIKDAIEEPSHWESGFIKPIENIKDSFKISNAQDSGRVEVLEGKYIKEKEIHHLHFKMQVIKNDIRMVNSERVYTINGNEMSFIMKMTTQKIVKHQQHLHARLIRKKSS